MYPKPIANRYTGVSRNCSSRMVVVGFESRPTAKFFTMRDGIKKWPLPPILKKETTREKLINAIVDLSGGELEEKDRLVRLAKESDEELLDRLIEIARFYAHSID